MASPRTSSAATPAGSRPTFFTVRAVILAAVMLTVVTVLPRYDLGGWNPYAPSYQSRIEFYADRMDSLVRVSTWRERLFLRHVGNYEIPMWIATHRRATDVIQLPPRSYAARYLQADPIWTDPRIFTYFADFQPIVAWTDLPRRPLANTWVALEPGGIALVRRDGTTNIDSLLQEYQRSEAGGLP